MKALAVIESDDIPEDADRHDELAGVIDTKNASVETARAIIENDNWERGDPCPECGNETLSVLAAEQDFYVSDGEFRFAKKGDYVGPQISIICGECDTMLRDIPIEKLLDQL